MQFAVLLWSGLGFGAAAGFRTVQGVPGEVEIIITGGTGVKVMGKIRVPPDAGIGVRVRAKDPVGGALSGVKSEMW